ncbi:hypothetical protein BDQ17DRAFT_1334065 [Cyathus striatus]|nr:hypothetical protein BDQ17DRAFT_1334065 [Cyathus striatus]
MADADLYNFEFLSLVAKITQEIDNYTGINSKTLAEFVINLHDQANSLPAFKAELIEVGAKFTIHSSKILHPKHKNKSATAEVFTLAPPFRLDSVDSMDYLTDFKEFRIVRGIQPDSSWTHFGLKICNELESNPLLTHKSREQFEHMLYQYTKWPYIFYRQHGT